MSSKINVREILSYHLSTLKDDRTGKISKIDLGIFYLLPLVMSGLAIFFAVELAEKVLETFVTIGALLSGLMLNLLVLIFDRRSKLHQTLVSFPGDRATITRLALLQELYYNICYLTVSALALTTLPLLGLQMLEKKLCIPLWHQDVIHVSIVKDLLTPILIFLGVHMALTMLMVIKRTFKLLDD